jgi:hypothetical protein
VGTNVTNGRFNGMGIGSDGRMYFLGNSGGIKVLNDSTGDIEATNITIGRYLAMGIGSDGRTVGRIS